MTFSMPKNMVEYKWEFGTYFTYKKKFVEALKTHEVHSRRKLKLQKNDMFCAKRNCN